MGLTVTPKNILSHFKKEKEREDLANERSGIIFSDVSLGGVNCIKQLY